jgi:twitching motility protein PilI
MHAATVMDPVAVLRAMETACQNAAAGLPEDIEPSEVWTGIAFRLGDQQLLVAVGEVIETLSLPQLTAVPNTADWVRGIANVRGRLLPVLDLHGLLYGEAAQAEKRSRVLVIDFEELYFGLVVDEVHGLRHYPAEALVSAGNRMDEALGPYVNDGIEDEDVFRIILRISALSACERFMQTAV